MRLAKQKLVNNLILIHYGAPFYKKGKFKSIKNRTNKPEWGTGLWTSPIDSTYGWMDWCNSEGWFKKDVDNSKHFLIKLKPNAKVLYINNINDLATFPVYTPVWADGTDIFRDRFPDFEKLSKKYDAIWLTEEGQWATRMSYPMDLYGWDCDCLLILNKKAIRKIKSKKYDNIKKEPITDGCASETSSEESCVSTY